MQLTFERRDNTNNPTRMVVLLLNHPVTHSVPRPTLTRQRRDRTRENRHSRPFTFLRSASTTREPIQTAGSSKKLRKESRAWTTRQAGGDLSRVTLSKDTLT